MADTRASTKIIIVVIFFFPETAYQRVATRSSSAPAKFRSLSFAITQGTNVSFVYCIDSFPPVAGEVTVTQLAFKCSLILALLPSSLSLLHKPLVKESGYSAAYGATAGI
ncbi:hypothetical protein BJX65DRAFT_313460 [Aspergillus insuetus]